jgi:hypothetical protein
MLLLSGATLDSFRESLVALGGESCCSSLESGSDVSSALLVNALCIQNSEDSLK